VHTHESPHMCTHMRVHICAHTWEFTYVHTHESSYMCTHMRVHICAHTWEFTYVHTHESSHMCTHMRLHIIVCAQHTRYCFWMLLSFTKWLECSASNGVSYEPIRPTILAYIYLSLRITLLFIQEPVPRSNLGNSYSQDFDQKSVSQNYVPRNVFGLP